MKFVITFYRAERPAAFDDQVPPTNRMQWRWHMKARGLFVGECMRGFDSRGDALKNCSAVTGFEFKAPPGAPTEFHYAKERKAVKHEEPANA